MNLKIHSSQPLRAALDAEVVDAVGRVFKLDAEQAKGLSSVDQSTQKTARSLLVRGGFTYEVSVKVVAWPGMHMREVKVYRNITEDEHGRLAIFMRFPSESHYQVSDSLELAYEFEYSTSESNLPDPRDFDAYQVAVDKLACEAAFARCNHGSPDEDSNYQGRSLSVGDVVEVDGRRYACESVGFEHITEAALFHA